MQLTQETKGNRNIIRGTLAEVQASIEQVDVSAGGLVLGAGMAMIAGRQKDLKFPLWANPAVEAAPFEVTVTLGKDGDPVSFQMRFLEEVPAHG